jgi:hypothetical protein
MIQGVPHKRCGGNFQASALTNEFGQRRNAIPVGDPGKLARVQKWNPHRTSGPAFPGLSCRPAENALLLQF